MGLRQSYIENLDRAERGEWAQRFSMGNSTVGVVMLTVMRERDSYWMKPSIPKEPKYASQLRDGTKLRRGSALSCSAAGVFVAQQIMRETAADSCPAPEGNRPLESELPGPSENNVVRCQSM